MKIPGPGKVGNGDGDGNESAAICRAEVVEVGEAVASGGSVSFGSSFDPRIRRSWNLYATSK